MQSGKAYSLEDIAEMINKMEGKMQPISIKSIPHKKQRYETCGDWYTDKKGVMNIRVSNCGNEPSEFAVAIHECIEQFLCRLDGITQKQVDDFDKAWNAAGGDNENDEPGIDPNAPYFEQHKISTKIERILIKACGENWKEHENRLGDLFKDE